jgi:3-polyprenyl-4-hydroxybenzoate decarboxylase
MNEENISINNEKIANDENNIEKELNNEEKKNMIVNASFSRVLFDKSMNDKVSIISNLINQKNDIKSFFSTNTNNLNNELSKSPKKKKDDDLMNEFKKLKMILNAKENEFNNLKEQYMKKKKKLYQQNINFKKNQNKLDIVRRNNTNLKLMICKTMSK